ncbi:hypothetical protein M422DRAFT_273308 [Sphaerobolus stellatus SS14]|uniref:Uncharacterized protein n=1 Tax=Sphaerobolus stellatus (strain SS14) TaxID=990650 RepID=A0A0C9UJZ6_SPHS4|nr:hypothetical protein M422DRAFT_273308 [Sphaerobolus stellatus SS14]
MSVSTRESQYRTGAVDQQPNHVRSEGSTSTSLGSWQPQHYRLHNSLYGTRCPRLDDEHVNGLLRKYENKGVSDRRKVSQLLAEEHGIFMSEATVARRRRILGLAKRPAAPTKLEGIEKKLYVWKHKDVAYSGLRKSRGIQKSLKEKEEIYITEKEISQPLPELDVWMAIIKDTWTEVYLSWSPLCCDLKTLPYEIIHEMSQLLRSIPEETTLKYSNGQDFKAFNIFRDYISSGISLEEAMTKLSRLPEYPISEVKAPEGSQFSEQFNQVMQYWQGERHSWNSTDVRHRILAQLICKHALWKEFNAIKGPTFRDYWRKIIPNSCSKSKRLNTDQFTKQALLSAISRDGRLSEYWSRFSDVWYYLYPSKVMLFTLKGSNLWDYFERILPLWVEQFNWHTVAGDWMLTEGFVNPVGRLPISPSSDPPHRSPTYIGTKFDDKIRSLSRISIRAVYSLTRRSGYQEAGVTVDS